MIFENDFRGPQKTSEENISNQEKNQTWTVFGKKDSWKMGFINDKKEDNIY